MLGRLKIAVISLLIAASPASADDVQQARRELWLSLSATLLVGGIAGSFALKVAALNDRYANLPLISRERPQLQDDILATERLAWGFGTAASLLAVTTVFVWVYQPVTPVVGVGELGVRYRGQF
jgi:hypothetical protein